MAECGAFFGVHCVQSVGVLRSERRCGEFESVYRVSNHC